MRNMVVFIGNPGVEYKNTRHNTPWLFKSYLKLDNTENAWREKFHAFYMSIADRIYLVPQTYVNESGISVQACSGFFQIPPSSILIVHDDIELPFGTVKLQRGGGMGGHNGLRSVRQHLGTDDFWRLRMGIGRPEHGNDVASFVLGRFSELEERCLEDTFSKAEKLLAAFPGSEK